MRFLGESIETLLTKLNDLEQNGGQHIPAIAITSWITDSLAQIINAGFRGYLLKPIDLDELVSMIRHLVRVKKTKVFPHRSGLEAKLGAKRLAIARASKELAAFYPSH
jgi:DNA-binding response OmpR family regulator